MLPGQSIEGSPEPEMVQPTPQELEQHYNFVKDYDKAIAAIKRAPPTSWLRKIDGCCRKDYHPTLTVPDGSRLVTRVYFKCRDPDCQKEISLRNIHDKKSHYVATTAKANPCKGRHPDDLKRKEYACFEHGGCQVAEHARYVLWTRTQLVGMAVVVPSQQVSNSYTNNTRFSRFIIFR